MGVVFFFQLPMLRLRRGYVRGQYKLNVNTSKAQLFGPEEIAGQLIAKAGVVAEAAIIADLNLELGKDQSTFVEIIARIERDPPLAERVLHLANSAWFASRLKVKKVEEAFSRLGVRDFYRVSVAAALHFHLGDGPDNERWWQESEYVAHTCEILAHHLNPMLVDAAFYSGLFRDCAVPFLRTQLQDFGYLVNDALGFDPGSIAAERECNQTDHATVGARIVQAFKFPESYAAAVRQHHAGTLGDVARDEDKQLLAILLLGQRVAAWSGRGLAAFHDEPAETRLLMEAAVAFRVTKEAIDDVLLEMMRLHELRRSMGGTP